MNQYYEAINHCIENHVNDYMTLVQDMYDHPETGFQEFHAQEILSDYLIKAGFTVKKSVACETDFIGEYVSQKEGPIIAFMCEYDALPEVGHGCGHNLIAGIGIAAGKTLKNIGRSRA